MTKHILEQYCDIQEELKELNEYRNSVDFQLFMLRHDKAILRVVGNANESVVFLGKNKKELDEAWSKSKEQINKKYVELVKKQNEVNDFINEIEDSCLRRIIRFRYIDCMTWSEVAAHIDGNTIGSVKQMFYRFIENQ